MARQRSKRVVVGSILKSKEDGKPDYLKFNLVTKDGNTKVPGGTLTIKDGQTLTVETRAYQLQNLERSLQDNKITEEFYNKQKENMERTNFVRADLVMYIDN